MLFLSNVSQPGRISGSPSKQRFLPNYALETFPQQPSGFFEQFLSFMCTEKKNDLKVPAKILTAAVKKKNTFCDLAYKSQSTECLQSA